MTKYLDNITISGKTQKEHDENLHHFMNVAKQYNVTFNEDKCTHSASSIDLLECRISQGALQTDQSLLSRF